MRQKRTLGLLGAARLKRAGEVLAGCGRGAGEVRAKCGRGAGEVTSFRAKEALPRAQRGRTSGGAARPKGAARPVTPPEERAHRAVSRGRAESPRASEAGAESQAAISGSPAEGGGGMGGEAASSLSVSCGGTCACACACCACCACACDISAAPRLHLGFLSASSRLRLLLAVHGIHHALGSV